MINGYKFFVFLENSGFSGYYFSDFTNYWNDNTPKFNIGGYNF